MRKTRKSHASDCYFEQVFSFTFQNISLSFRGHQLPLGSPKKGSGFASYLAELLDFAEPLFPHLQFHFLPSGEVMGVK